MQETPFVHEETANPHAEKLMADGDETLEVAATDKTDSNVLRVLELNMLPVARKGLVQGWDNFELSRHLPEELRNPETEDRQLIPVIATTHHTDNDVPMTMLRFGRKTKAGVASFASNQRGKLYGRLMKSRQGRDVFDVENDTKTKKNQGLLRQNDFEAMAKAIADGTSVILSSYAPHYKNKQTGSEYGDRILPDEPGLGVVLLANMSDRVILPVAMNWQGKGRFGIATDIMGQLKSYIQNRGRPRADMNIAKPIFLDKDVPESIRTSKEDVELAFAMLTDRRHDFSPQKLAEAKEVWTKLKEQAKLVMVAQAEVSQPESRGAWRDSLTEESIEHAPESNDYESPPSLSVNEA